MHSRFIVSPLVGVIGVTMKSHLEGWSLLIGIVH
jgi:hypothetical protein